VSDEGWLEHLINRHVTGHQEESPITVTLARLGVIVKESVCIKASSYRNRKTTIEATLLTMKTENIYDSKARIKQR
jgi:hypothetical protein